MIVSHNKKKYCLRIDNANYDAIFIAIYSGEQLLSFGCVEPKSTRLFHAKYATRILLWNNIKHDHIGYSIFKRDADEDIAL